MTVITAPMVATTLRALASPVPPPADQDLLLCAEAPRHRVEHAPPEGDRVPLLSALRPELGWPHWLLRVPMRWRGESRFERLHGLDWQVEPFVPPSVGQPGEPWRFSIDVALFPPCATREPRGASVDTGSESGIDVGIDVDGDVASEVGGEVDIEMNGLLLLGLYLEPRAVVMEGERQGVMHELSAPELNQQVAWALDELFELPPHRWAHGFVPSPGEVDAQAAAMGEAMGEAGGEADGVCFVVAACQYPPGILDVSPGCELDPTQAGPALAALARMHRFARSTALGRRCSLALFAGDQIYADASGGLADSRSGVERYARSYNEFKAGPARLLPQTVARVVHGIDDHEIVDNWEPGARDDIGPWFSVARQAAWDHRWEAGARVGGPEALWHDFEWRGASFFIADARCEREARRVANWSTARMWSAVQREAFVAWLGRSAGRPRFMMSGSLPLPRRRATAEHPSSSLRSDAWDGYPHSLHELLGEVWRARATGLVFLSGDEHRSGWVSAEISAVDGIAEGDAGGEPVRIHSVHSSALYAPWPFAITAKEELAAPEAFEFDGPDGRRLRCVVSAWEDHPGDGFAVMRVRGGAVDLWFDRAGDPVGDATDAHASW